MAIWPLVVGVFIGNCCVLFLGFYIGIAQSNSGSVFWLVTLMLIIALLASALIVKLFFGRYYKFLAVIKAGLLYFQDGEFAVKLMPGGDVKLQELRDIFNQVAHCLQESRQQIVQREFLLETIFDKVTSALLLTDHRKKIVLANPAARQLLGAGKAIKGMTLSDVLELAPPHLADALIQLQDVLLYLDGEQGEPEVWHLSCQAVRLNGFEHCLYHLKPVTRTISRVEVDTWKQVVRVFSHELNNSLAPIISLAHSGNELQRRLTINKADAELMQSIFNIIKERAVHLNDFLGAYAQFSRLPKPQMAAIHWADILSNIQPIVAFEVDFPLPLRPGWGDTGQLSQVLINIVRNASEADAKKIVLQIASQGEWDRLIVADDGCGMDATQLQRAMLPFYSTKREGTGIGLALCREIIDAHGGRIKIANRSQGGIEVIIWLPAIMTATQ